MPQIQVLSDLLANKIAAGEVIERPSSVVKELVENSIDAGATCIEITIEGGGQKLIRIVDNGGGMDAEDLALCIRPHATSKLRNENDLFSIRTMGFRGEALPSIGAVAQLRIASRQPAADVAHEVCVAGEHVEPIRVTAGPPGTTVEVRQLFFNVPARQKFLRTAQTEIGHITEQLARIALVHPGIEFRLTHNGRNVHHLRPSEGMRSRVRDFYGREMADELMEIHRDERGLKLFGYVAPPADSRSSPKWQYLFLNGRFIRDRFISHAVREAYRGLMDPNRHPVVFLSLEVDPSTVDVNVHPTKAEVRWRDSNMIYSQVLSSLRDRFLNADLTPAFNPNRAQASLTSFHDAAEAAADQQAADAAPLPSGTSASGSASLEVPSDAEDAEAEQRRRRIRESMADFFKRARPMATGSPLPTITPRAIIQDAAPPRISPPPTDGSVGSQSGHLLGDPGSQVALEPPLRPDAVIQIHRCYLVAESPEGLVIIDQHALHERILFEQLSRQFSRGPLESQRLLIPDVIDVSPEQVGLIESHDDTLHRLGIELSAYGPAAVAVHASPSLLRPERTREFIRDLLDRLADRQAPASTEMLTQDLLSMMACKAAVKAGDPLSQEEIVALMAQRPKTERSSNCPHGRPTALRLSIADLERQFKRTGF